MGGQHISNTRYADDTICSSKKDLIELLKAVKAAGQQSGLLLLNTKKTKVMMVVDEERNVTGNNFSVDGEVIEEVEALNFLAPS